MQTESVVLSHLCCACVGAALQPMTKLQAGTSPVIFKQQQVVVQQMTPAGQSYVKSAGGGQSIGGVGGGGGGTHIQHIITSLPVVTASASSAVPTAAAAGLIVGSTAVTTSLGVTPSPQVTFTKTLSLTISTTAIPTGQSVITGALCFYTLPSFKKGSLLHVCPALRSLSVGPMHILRKLQ